MSDKYLNDSVSLPPEVAVFIPFDENTPLVQMNHKVPRRLLIVDNNSFRCCQRATGRDIALINNSITTNSKATVSDRSAMDTITSTCTRPSRYSAEAGQITSLDRFRDPRTRPSAVNEIDRSLSPSESDVECGYNEGEVRRRTVVVSPPRPARMVQLVGLPTSFPTEEEQKPVRSEGMR